MHIEGAVEPAADLPEVGRATRVALFRLMLLQRHAEDRIMARYRQGRISGSVYTGRGQEGVAAACGLALGPDDVVAPLNRELACHFARGVEVAHVFRNFLGRSNGPTRGRDGTCTPASPSETSSRSSRCSVASAQSRLVPRSRSSIAASRESR